MRTLNVLISLQILIFLLVACEKEPKIPTAQQITRLVLETINQDLLNNSFPISTNLINRYMYQQQYDKELGYIPPPPRSLNGEPFAFRLYKKTSKNDLLAFNQKDFLIISEQIIKNKNISLDQSFLPKTHKFMNIPANNYDPQKVYKFLLPLFNSTMDFAIVEYDFQCASCGYGRSVYFKRYGNKWIKIASFLRWRT